MLEDFEKWLRQGGATGNALGEETISTYLKVAASIAKAKSPTAILKRGLSMATKLKYVAVLRQWAAFTEDGELAAAVKRGPELRRLLQARSSKLPEKIESFTDEEVRRFLNVVDRLKGKEPAWVWPCIYLQVYLGLRAGADLAGLRRDSVMRAVRTEELAVMGKRDRMDVMPAGFMHDELEALAAIPGWDIVADLISPDTKKLPEHQHRENAYRNYRKILIAIDEVSQIGASRTHRFRHWAITNFIKNIAKGDLKRAQRFARHNSLVTTMRYYRTVDLAEDDAALAQLKKGT